MPQFNILKTADIKKTARVLQLNGIFDIPPTERAESRWDIDFPYDAEPWKIGLIVGPSGSGKSTIAREAFQQAKHICANTGYDWPAGMAIVDGFNQGLSIKAITGALSSVGFSTPPAWVRPYECLSTGEQFRATMARALTDTAALVVMDEFTSVVDRTVAQVGSAAIAKAARRHHEKQIVAVTCHYDVAEWLQPDWILEMPSGTFTRRLLRARPEISLEIVRCHHKTWGIFREHHYLNTSLNKAAVCFAALWNGKPVAFTAVLHFPHKSGSWWREHRTVCLPDFQGVGIGNRLSEYVASLFVATGKRFRSVTGNPAMVEYRRRSPLWRQEQQMKLPCNRKRASIVTTAHIGKSMATSRYTASFTYAGEARVKEARLFGLL